MFNVLKKENSAQLCSIKKVQVYLCILYVQYITVSIVMFQYFQKSSPLKFFFCLYLWRHQAILIPVWKLMLSSLFSPPPIIGNTRQDRWDWGKKVNMCWFINSITAQCARSLTPHRWRERERERERETGISSMSNHSACQSLISQ